MLKTNQSIIIKQRKIKFRAWDKINKEMFIPTSLALLEPCLSVFGAKNNIRRDLKDVILQQYTGLKDRKGIEIYEGDEVKCFGKVYKVVFGNKIHIGFWLIQICVGFRESVSLTNHSQEYEIIGNIYENKELYIALT